MYRLYSIFIFLSLYTNVFHSQNSLKVDFEFVNFGDDNNDRRKKYQSILKYKQSYFISTEISDANSTKKDSNGVILEYKNAGRFTPEYLFSKNTKLNSPKGMCVTKEALFVADIDRIVVFDIATGNFNYQINFSNYSQSIYDLAKINDTTIIISATDKGVLFKLNINTGEICEFGIKITGITALHYEDHDSSLYCGSVGDKKTKGQILKIDLKSGNGKVLNKDAGRCYGISKFQDYLIYTTWDDGSDIPNLYTLLIGSSKASSWEMPEGTWGKNWGNKPHMRQPCIFSISKRSKHSADLYIPDNKMGVIYQVNIEEIK